MLEQFDTEEFVVAGNSSVNALVVSEKGPFRLLNMIVPDNVAPHFFVTDIKVGRNSQTISTGCIPASFFTERAKTLDLAFDTLPRGMTMTVSVTNSTPEAKKFKASMRGLLVGNEKGTHASDLAVLGLGHILIFPGQTARCRVQAQVVFKPNRLIIPTEILNGLRVSDLRVVGESAMSRDLVNGEMDLDTSIMQIGDWLSIDVVNESNETKAFYGSVLGSMPH